MRITISPEHISKPSFFFFYLELDFFWTSPSPLPYRLSPFFTPALYLDFIIWWRIPPPPSKISNRLCVIHFFFNSTFSVTSYCHSFLHSFWAFLIGPHFHGSFFFCWKYKMINLIIKKNKRNTQPLIKCHLKYRDIFFLHLHLSQINTTNSTTSI